MALKFLPAEVTTPREVLIKRAVDIGVPRQEIEKLLDEMANDEVFLSECGTYQVTRRLGIANSFGAEMICLSIKRIDKEAIHDWRHLQEIKNALVGEECEAVELYPAESRLVDTSNQYWLWCFADPEVRMPFGFTDRVVCNETTMEGTKQRSRK